MISAMLAAASLAQQQPQPEIAMGYSLGALCQFVAENIQDPVTPPESSGGWMWRTIMLRSAGVEINVDTPDVVRAKMQAWWAGNQDNLICNVPNSYVRNGSMLKLAVDSSNYDFINDAVRRWKVDLNRIDADGKTVLDFIDDQRTKSAGYPRFATLNRYYNIFAMNGAKHARDLK